MSKFNLGGTFLDKNSKVPALDPERGWVHVAPFCCVVLCFPSPLVPHLVPVTKYIFVCASFFFLCNQTSRPVLQFPCTAVLQNWLFTKRTAFCSIWLWRTLDTISDFVFPLPQILSKKDQENSFCCLRSSVRTSSSHLVPETTTEVLGQQRTPLSTFFSPTGTLENCESGKLIWFVKWRHDTSKKVGPIICLPIREMHGLLLSLMKHQQLFDMFLPQCSCSLALVRVVGFFVCRFNKRTADLSSLRKYGRHSIWYLMQWRSSTNEQFWFLWGFSRMAHVSERDASILTTWQVGRIPFEPSPCERATCMHLLVRQICAWCFPFPVQLIPKIENTALVEEPNKAVKSFWFFVASKASTEVTWRAACVSADREAWCDFQLSSFQLSDFLSSELTTPPPHLIAKVGRVASNVLTSDIPTLWDTPPPNPVAKVGRVASKFLAFQFLSYLPLIAKFRRVASNIPTFQLLSPHLPNCKSWKGDFTTFYVVQLSDFPCFPTFLFHVFQHSVFPNFLPWTWLWTNAYRRELRLKRPMVNLKVQFSMKSNSWKYSCHGQFVVGCPPFCMVPDFISK